MYIYIFIHAYTHICILRVRVTHSERSFNLYGCVLSDTSWPDSETIFHRPGSFQIPPVDP